MKTLNQKGIDNLTQKELLEEKLECEFKIIERPVIGGLQNITEKFNKSD